MSCHSAISRLKWTFVKLSKKTAALINDIEVCVCVCCTIAHVRSHVAVDDVDGGRVQTVSRRARRRVVGGDSLHVSTTPVCCVYRVTCAQSSGVYLTDLTFVEEGNPNKLDNKICTFVGRVWWRVRADVCCADFVKQRFVYNIIHTVLRFQSIPYSSECMG
jgi:hypothetical protein